MDPNAKMLFSLFVLIILIYNIISSIFSGNDEQEKEEDSSKKSDILQDPCIIGFYKTTMAAWSAGSLLSLSNDTMKVGKISYEEFVKIYKPVEGGALLVFFTQFPLHKDEFLVAVGDSEDEFSTTVKGWFVLTNHRLIQKDGRDKSFKEVILTDVNTFDIKGFFTKTIVFQMKSGGIIDFEKVDIHPSEKALSEIINQKELKQ